MKLTFKIEGEKQLSRNLRIDAKQLKDYTTPLKETGAYMKDFTETDVFSTQGKIIGEPWKALSTSYASRKKGSQLLVESGKMRDSFYYESGREYVIIGNSTDYFKYHQSNRPRFKLPRRVMLKIDNPRKEEIVRIFNKYIQEVIK